ncbi:MAG: aspartate--tRNA ligase [Cytophagales bacterium]|nr:aspartate--tRNA ligase [Cytophagales bacterium]
MLRTHTCGELRPAQVGQAATLCGWVQKIRDKGSILWIDLRDRYGITQLILEEGAAAQELFQQARTLGREYVVQACGVVVERASKNSHIPTGEVELRVQTLTVLSPAKLPPFLIEDETDGSEDLRMQYRYLDLRRAPMQRNLMLRHRLLQQTRTYLEQQQFIEVETPMLIKSTPEGARDFVVPSRIHPGHFYALPQSPQTFKQLLMVAGFDRYYQLVKCFRDEDLRADRQPEFTQIDCELTFVTQETIFHIFEGLVKHLFQCIKGITLEKFQRLSYAEAIRLYGTDKPDLRVGMPFIELNSLAQGKGFRVFDEAALVVGICVPGGAGYTRKQLEAWTEFVKKPPLGAKGLVYVKYNSDGSIKSSVDKFFSRQQLSAWTKAAQAQPGDMLLIVAGEVQATRQALDALRLKIGDALGLRAKEKFAPLWVVDFPLLQWDAEAQRYTPMHHPFTAPQQEDIPLLEEKPEAVHAHAYDMVINGVELGGGSIRIHEKALQAKMFKVLGLRKEEAKQQFGFLMDAFEYGAPPHGGIALGFDRLCALLGGTDSIRAFIAFPKNNAGRDVMIGAPSTISEAQLNALHII